MFKKCLPLRVHKFDAAKFLNVGVNEVSATNKRSSLKKTFLEEKIAINKDEVRLEPQLARD